MPHTRCHARLHAAIDTVLSRHDIDESEILATEIMAVINGHGYKPLRDDDADDWRPGHTPRTGDQVIGAALARAELAHATQGH